MTTTAKEKVSEEKKVEQMLPPVDKVTMPPSNSPFGNVVSASSTFSGVKERAEGSVKELEKEVEQLRKISSEVKGFRPTLEIFEGNDKANKIFENIERAEESLDNASAKIAQGSSKEELQRDIDESRKYLEKSHQEAEKLLKDENLSQDERKSLERFLISLDKTLVSLNKLGLSNRDSMRKRQNDEIFERTLLRHIIKNKETEDQAMEETMVGLSKYYLALRDMKNEIEKVNKEELSQNEKEEKLNEIYNQHYEQLKNGNTKHDETLSSFIIYNMTLEYGSEEKKENVSDKIYVEDENGKKSTLKDRCNKEITKLYNDCISDPNFGWNEKNGCYQIN
jgi:hypothetical protein